MGVDQAEAVVLRRSVKILKLGGRVVGGVLGPVGLVLWAEDAYAIATWEGPSPEARNRRLAAKFRELAAVKMMPVPVQVQLRDPMWQRKREMPPPPIDGLVWFPNEGIMEFTCRDRAYETLLLDHRLMLYDLQTNRAVTPRTLCQSGQKDLAYLLWTVSKAASADFKPF